MLLRTVVEEHFFMDELKKLKTKYPRIYDVKDAVSWELSKRPDVGLLLPSETSYRVFNTFSVGDSPTFTVLYKYDEKNDVNNIYLLGIRPINNESYE